MVTLLQELSIPSEITNWIDGISTKAASGEVFDKLASASGELICTVVRSRTQDVELAVRAAKLAQPTWAETPAVQRGLLLHKLVAAMQRQQEQIASVVAAETGKSFKDVMGETSAAIQLGLFFASEGQRMYGRTTTSAVPNKYALTVRQPIGVAALIIAANTPIANVAWKIFPTLVCGNTAVLKASEDTPPLLGLWGNLLMRSVSLAAS